MKIRGKIHCFFEQSGTFKNEFKKLDYEAFDYDIQDKFGETDFKFDFFEEIENGYKQKPSIFDYITKDDLIIAFFPCIYFTGSSNPLFFNGTAYHKPILETIDLIIDRNRKRALFYEYLMKFVYIVKQKKIRMIFENPYNGMHYLINNFIKKPSVIDYDRTLRGDFVKKPTGYWYFNCEPTYGESYQKDKKQRYIRSMPKSKGDGMCSLDQSLMSPDYARNFICDFILGKKQNMSGQLKLEL